MASVPQAADPSLQAVSLTGPDIRCHSSSAMPRLGQNKQLPKFFTAAKKPCEEKHWTTELWNPSKASVTLLCK